MTRWHRIFISGTAVIVFLALWEVTTSVGLVNVSNVSRPIMVAKAYVELVESGEIFHHLAASLKAFILGFILAIVFGIPVGVILGRYRILSLFFDPILMALYTMPRLTLLPILVVWFGIGLQTTVIVVFLGAIFPIFVNTAVGIRGADPTLIRAIKSFCGNEWDVFTKVLVPGSVLPIMTGVRLGVGRGTLGVVVCEMFASTEGIGEQIALYGNAFRISELIATISIVSLWGLVSVHLLRMAEEKLRYRRMET